MRTAAWAGIGALIIGAAARVTLPLPGADLPQSAQTLAVLLVGAWMGASRGLTSVTLYILAGALGLPVFADGASGLQTALGPSGGYLLGFACAAGIVGRLADAEALARPWWRTLGAMLGAHAVILALGWAWLALLALGPSQAWSAGVAPFLVGGAAKSVLAAAAVWGVARMRSAPPPR